MAFRMYRYVVRIWERWLAENPDSRLLPPILPLVFYHGERRWNAALELCELIDVAGLDAAELDELRPYLPRLKFMLDDLGEVPDAALPRQPPVHLTLLLFKHGRKPELLELLAANESDLRAMVTTDEARLRVFGFLVQYILTVNDHVTKEALGEMLTTVGREVGEMAMTEYDRLIEQGLQKGLQKGRQEVRASVARRLLAKGVAIEDVAELVELPIDEVRKLSQ